jgi:hypothetical protein
MKGGAELERSSDQPGAPIVGAVLHRVPVSLSHTMSTSALGLLRHGRLLRRGAEIKKHPIDAVTSPATAKSESLSPRKSHAISAVTPGTR